MAKKLPKPTDKVRGDPTWPFPTKFPIEPPKKVRRKKPDLTQYKESPF